MLPPSTLISASFTEILRLPIFVTVNSDSYMRVGKEGLLWREASPLSIGRSGGGSPPARLISRWSSTTIAGKSHKGIDNGNGFCQNINCCLFGDVSGTGWSNDD